LVILSSKYREEKKVKTRSIANLFHMPDEMILHIENILKSDRETMVSLKDISVSCCIDYGYVSVLLVAKIQRFKRYQQIILN